MLLKEPFEVKKEYRQSYDPKKDDFNKVVAAIDRGRLLSTLYEYIEIMIMSSSCGPNDRYSYTYIVRVAHMHEINCVRKLRPL